MKNILKLLLSAIIILHMAACATYEVYSDKDESIDFSKYKTFAWLPSASFNYGKGFSNEIIDNNIKLFASQEATNKGLTGDTTNPDLLFEYHVEIKSKVRTEQQPIYNYNNYYNRMHPYNPYWRYNNMNTPYIIGYKNVNIHYEEGTLEISAIERQSNKLVWRGWSVSTFDDDVEYEKDIHNDIVAIFKKFPIQGTAQSK